MNEFLRAFVPRRMVFSKVGILREDTLKRESYSRYHVESQLSALCQMNQQIL